MKTNDFFFLFVNYRFQLTRVNFATMLQPKYLSSTLLTWYICKCTNLALEIKLIYIYYLYKKQGVFFLFSLWNDLNLQ